MTTRGKKTIKYGRVEVVARAAKGDWLWPAICKLQITLRTLRTDTNSDQG
jgi:beta-glucanase (GH16 family)